MKATMESTTQVVEIDAPSGSHRPDAKGKYTRVMARAWEGVTEKGVRFTAYVSLVQVHKSENQAEFETALQEHVQPSSETQRAIDLRFFID